MGSTRRTSRPCADPGQHGGGVGVVVRLGVRVRLLLAVGLPVRRLLRLLRRRRLPVAGPATVLVAAIAGLGVRVGLAAVVRGTAGVLRRGRPGTVPTATSGRLLANHPGVARAAATGAAVRVVVHAGAVHLGWCVGQRRPGDHRLVGAPRAGGDRTHRPVRVVPGATGPPGPAHDRGAVRRSAATGRLRLAWTTPTGGTRRAAPSGVRWAVAIVTVALALDEEQHDRPDAECHEQAAHGDQQPGDPCALVGRWDVPGVSVASGSTVELTPGSVTLAPALGVTARA